MTGRKSDLAWRTSSYSANGSGQCVEVAPSPRAVAVRDSKNPSAGHLVLPAAEWTAFLTAARREAL